MKPKDTEKIKADKKEFSQKEREIANGWREFSKTLAFQDWMDYYHNTTDMLTSYAKERVMPSPVKNGEEVMLNNETCSSLLQNVRGCDIVVSYVEQYLEIDT